MRVKPVGWAVLLMGLLAVGALRSEDGVTATEVVLGQSAAFSGPASSLGSELWRGSEAYFAEVNAHGGVHGRQLRVTAQDDGYDPAKTLTNTIQLMTQAKPFALYNYVGTPTLVAALPVVRRYQPQGLFVFGAFSGAQPQREAPSKDVVFNVRASYRQETAALVNGFVKELGLKKIGTFVQSDPYGASGLDGVKRALKAHGLEVAAETTYRRGDPYGTSMAEQVKLLQAAGVQAVICVGAYTQCAAFIRDARAAGYQGWIANLSFVGAGPLLNLVKEEEAKGHPGLSVHLVNSQVVPNGSDTSLPVVAEFHAAMDKAKPQVPSGLGDGSYQPEAYGFVALEGYITARLFVDILKKVPEPLTRAGFTKAALKESLDLGGFRLAFDPATRQASSKVFITEAKGGNWASVHTFKDLQ